MVADNFLLFVDTALSEMRHFVNSHSVLTIKQKGMLTHIVAIYTLYFACNKCLASQLAIA